MLKITIPKTDMWDEQKQQFISVKEQTLQLEHSLVSLSKWESKWHKAFLTKKEKTYEETLDYIRCMTLTQNVDPLVYNALTRENIDRINAYIADPMTASYVYEDESNKDSNETVTSELIYYWMIALSIPVKFEKWHLNRLLMLIKICNVKNQPPKKRSKRDIMSRNKAMNEARRKALNSKG